MSLEGTIVGISRRRERLERGGVGLDSVNHVYTRHRDKVELTDTAEGDLEYAKRTIVNPDSVFIFGSPVHGILGTNKLGDSGFSEYSAWE